VDEAGGCEPDTDKDGNELAEADAVTRSQDVHVLKNVRN